MAGKSWETTVGNQVGLKSERERERDRPGKTRETHKDKWVARMAWRLSQKVPAEILALRAKEEELDSYT